ncbi:unnamed protein product [Boreogadus saida]
MPYNVTWLREGRPLAPDHRDHRDQLDFPDPRDPRDHQQQLPNGSLLLSPGSPGVEGGYSCMSSSALGTLTSRTLTVLLASSTSQDPLRDPSGVVTQLPPEGSVVPDDPITRHIVPQVSRGPAPPARPLNPPRGGNCRANGPARGAGSGRGAARGTTWRSASLASRNRGEGAVRRESVLVQFHHRPPGARHPQANNVSLARREYLAGFSHNPALGMASRTSRRFASAPPKLRACTNKHSPNGMTRNCHSPCPMVDAIGQSAIVDYGMLHQPCQPAVLIPNRKNRHRATGNAGTGQRPKLPGHNLATTPLAASAPVPSPSGLERRSLCADGDGCSGHVHPRTPTGQQVQADDA